MGAVSHGLGIARCFKGDAVAYALKVANQSTALRRLLFWLVGAHNQKLVVCLVCSAG